MVEAAPAGIKGEDGVMVTGVRVEKQDSGRKIVFGEVWE